MKLLSEEPRAHTHTAAEIRDILVSALILGFAFTVSLFSSSNPLNFILDPGFITPFLFTTFIVAASIIAKEMAQKGAARTMHSHATYRLWAPGALISVLSSFLPVVFAVVSGMKIGTEYAERHGKWRINLTTRQIGIIGIIGPLMSISIAMGLIMLSPLVGSVGGLNLFIAAAEINILIGLFALLPVGFLDGKKIIRWEVGLWIFLFLMALAVLALAKGWI